MSVLHIAKELSRIGFFKITSLTSTLQATNSGEVKGHV